MTAALAAATAAIVLLTGQPTPPPALIGGGSLDGSHAREWSVSRPSRGVAGSPVHRASQIPTWMRSWAACVLARESGGTLDRPWSGAGAVNTAGSSAQGRWQLLDTAWRVNGGIHFIVARRLAAFGLPAPQVRAIREYVRRTPIHQWPAPLQDVAFIQIVTEGGARHWFNGGRCDGLAP